MILEEEQLTARIMLTLAEALPIAAISDEEIITSVVPWQADGDLVAIEGLLNIEVLARAIVAEMSRDV